MSYFDIVQEFVEDSKRARDPLALGNVFGSFIARLGVKSFALASHVDWQRIPADAVGVTNYPEDWVSRFLHEGLAGKDPAFKTADKQVTPFNWHDPAWRAKLSKSDLQILSNAADFGLLYGITIPIHSGNAAAASCSLAFEVKDIDPNAVHALHVMSMYLHDAARRKGAAGNLILSRKRLTERQRQCLELVAQGKSDWVISRILSISEATARFHVSGAMRRLGVASRVQAVVRALLLGEIRFLDTSIEPEEQPSTPSEPKIVFRNNLYAVTP